MVEEWRRGVSQKEDMLLSDTSESLQTFASIDISLCEWEMFEIVEDGSVNVSEIILFFYPTF